MDRKLNKEQLEAVEYIDGPILILAGAGTGKTTVLVSRVEYLLDNHLCKPENILATTFTIKATEEMKTRIASKNLDVPQWIGTFHSLCMKIVKNYAQKLGLESDFGVVDGDRQKDVCKKLFGLQADEVLEKINFWKNNCKMPEELDNSQSLRGHYMKYQRHLMENNAVDFGDIIILCCKLWRENPDILELFKGQFEYVCIDEFQDTNYAQFTWLKLLTDNNTHIKLFCVGDDDQAIYTWRGSDNKHILNFTHIFPGAKTVRLEQNYRSTDHILKSALSVVEKNKQRLGKVLHSNKGIGDKVLVQSFMDDGQEMKWIVSNIRRENGTVAVLVRTTWHLVEVRKILSDQGLLAGKKYQGLMNYLRYLNNPTYELLAFIISYPKRGLGQRTVEKFLEDCQRYLYDEGEAGLYDEQPNTEEKWLEILEKYCSRAAQKEAFALLKKQLEKWHQMKEQNHVDLIKQISSMIDHEQDISFILSAALKHTNLKQFLDNFKMPDVSVLTIHMAKGLEFDSVYLPGWEEGVFPHSRSLTVKEMEEERRLAYVAITRGRYNVFISHVMVRKSPRGYLKRGVSRFISDIPRANAIFG